MTGKSKCNIEAKLGFKPSKRPGRKGMEALETCLTGFGRNETDFAASLRLWGPQGARLAAHSRRGGHRRIMRPLPARAWTRGRCW